MPLYVLPDEPHLRPIHGLGPDGILRPGDPPLEISRRLKKSNPADRPLLDAGLVLVEERRKAQVAERNFEEALAEAEREAERLRREGNILQKQLAEALGERDSLVEKVSGLQSELGETQLEAEAQRETIEELRQERGDLLARLAFGPWHNANPATVRAFANAVAEEHGLPPFSGSGATGRAIDWLDSLEDREALAARFEDLSE